MTKTLVATSVVFNIGQTFYNWSWVSKTCASLSTDPRYVEACIVGARMPFMYTSAMRFAAIALLAGLIGFVLDYCREVFFTRKAV